jgi:hypothetical protein
LFEGSSGETTLVISNTGPLPLTFELFEYEPQQRLLEGQPDDLQGKHILYDQFHGNPGFWDYSTLETDLLNAGATIDFNIEPITPDTLEGYDILWVAGFGTETWYYSELTAISDWLDEGGALLVNGPMSPATQPPASIYDIEFVSTGCYYQTTFDILPHRVTEGVEAIWLEDDCSYLEGPATPVVNDPGGMPHAVVMERGAGKMAVISDNDFVNWQLDVDDNRLFANNIFLWLVAVNYSDVPWLSEQPDSGSIPGHSSLEITVGFDASELSAGTYEAVIALEHNAPGQSNPTEIPVSLVVIGYEPGVSIEPDAQSAAAGAGVTVAYTYTLTNLGDLPDTFTLDVSGIWTTTLSADTTGELQPGETFVFTVSVTVPLEALDGEQDLALIIATSTNDPQVSASAEATTIAVVPPPPVEVYWQELPLVYKN